MTGSNNRGGFFSRAAEGIRGAVNSARGGQAVLDEVAEAKRKLAKARAMNKVILEKL